VTTTSLAGVDPAHVQEELAPGATLVVTKTVTTPEIPPLPDIYFLDFARNSPRTAFFRG
jgi:hypothetical protein